MSPSDGASAWVVVDDDFELHEGGCAFLTSLRAADRSVNTGRVYAGRVALFLSWCAAEGVDWTRPRLDHMVGFKRWLVADPVPTTGLRGARPRRRSAKSADAVLRTVCEFLRIGEALGLHREDMHFLPDSRALGCKVVGPHLHVRRRADIPNGALAKSLARAEISRLRAERDRQSHQLRLALGARVDQLDKADLAERVDELTRHNRQLSAELAQAQGDARRLQARVAELEDDLTAARTSLRRMIRAENLRAPVTTTNAVATTNGRSR